MSLEFDESVEWRILTGQVVGYRALRDYNRIAFVGMKNVMCMVIVSSVESSYISATGGECRYFVLNENYGDLAEKLEMYHPNLIGVFVENFKKSEVHEKVLESFFSILAERNIDADFLFGIQSFTKFGVKRLRENENIRNYLEDKRVMAYTFNFDEGLVEIREIYLLKDSVYSEVIEEYPISFRLASILNKSMSEGMIKFERGDVL